MAYTSAEFEQRTRHVPTNVTSSLLRDRWRLMEMERRTKLRVTSFNLGADPAQCMPGQHICGTFGSRATAALSDHLQQQQQQQQQELAHAHFDRVYLDYVRLPRGYVEQAYECVPSMLISMLASGLLPLHGEAVLPLFAGLGESLAQAFVQQPRRTAMKPILVPLQPAPGPLAPSSAPARIAVYPLFTALPAARYPLHAASLQLWQRMGGHLSGGSGAKDMAQRGAKRWGCFHCISCYDCCPVCG
jgi:hypothetical protein